MIIIGIDPGTSRMGYGLIKTGRKINVLDYGIISPLEKISQEERLLIISKELRKIFRKYNPQYLAIEKLFFFKNLKTAMTVSEAKGVVLLEAAKRKIKVIQLSPLQIKNAISGYGRASKKQMQQMIKKRLSLKEVPKPDDAADALSVAFCALLFLKLDRNLS